MRRIRAKDRALEVNLEIKEPDYAQFIFERSKLPSVLFGIVLRKGKITKRMFAVEDNGMHGMSIENVSKEKAIKALGCTEAEFDAAVEKAEKMALDKNVQATDAIELSQDVDFDEPEATFGIFSDNGKDITLILHFEEEFDRTEEEAGMFFNGDYKLAVSTWGLPFGRKDREITAEEACKILECTKEELDAVIDEAFKVAEKEGQSEIEWWQKEHPEEMRAAAKERAEQEAENDRYDAWRERNR